MIAMLEQRIFFILFGCLLYSSCCSQTERDTSITLYFATNSAELDGSQHQTLDAFSLAFRIKAIKGYADTTGSGSYNYLLSKKRAYSVYSALGTTDASDKIELLFLGESTEEPELAKNRKVQVVAGLLSKKVAGKPIAGKVGDSGTYNNPPRETPKHTPAIVRTLDLEYIYFVPDQAIITYESLPYIHEIAEMLKTYKTESFDIIGHVNYQSRLDSTHLRDLYQLSERRAKAVYDLLVEQGIVASRMSYKGVGNSQPLYPKPASEEQKRKNMRVQIVIKQ
jgi:outer membrane protein OmpA-like peptidoglycan-associated protein